MQLSFYPLFQIDTKLRTVGTKTDTKTKLCQKHISTNYEKNKEKVDENKKEQNQNFEQQNKEIITHPVSF